MSLQTIDRLKKDLVSIASLFTSFSTLFCCALPALLVTLGLGAALAGFLMAFPWFQTIVKHHHLLFLIAGSFLLLNGLLLFRKRPGASCPPGKATEGGSACETAHRWNFWIFWVSVGVFSIGAAFTYILPLFLFGGWR